MKNKKKFFKDNATLRDTLKLARIDQQKSLIDWCTRELKRRGYAN